MKVIAKVTSWQTFTIILKSLEQESINNGTKETKFTGPNQKSPKGALKHPPQKKGTLTPKTWGNVTGVTRYICAKNQNYLIHFEGWPKFAHVPGV